MGKVVVGLGGNGLGKWGEEEVKLVKNRGWWLIGVMEGGKEVVMREGKGGEVGEIKVGMDFGGEKGKRGGFGLGECGGMREG